MATKKVGNRHDAMACQDTGKKHKVKANAHAKGHLEVKLGKIKTGKKRMGSGKRHV